jgi:hypothetical protein
VELYPSMEAARADCKLEATTAWYHHTLAHARKAGLMVWPDGLSPAQVAQFYHRAWTSMKHGKKLSMEEAKKEEEWLRDVAGGCTRMIQVIGESHMGMAGLPNMWPKLPSGMSHGARDPVPTHRWAGSPIPTSAEGFELPKVRVPRCPSVREMFRRRRERPPLGRLDQQDLEGWGQYVLVPMPKDEAAVDLRPRGDVYNDLGLETAMARAMMSNFTEEFPELRREAEDLLVWWNRDLGQIRTGMGDDRKLVSDGLAMEKGAPGDGLLAKLEVQRSHKAPVLSSKGGGADLATFCTQNPEMVGRFTVTPKGLKLHFEPRPGTGTPRFHGAAYATRPFAGRFLLGATALATGKQSSIKDGDSIQTRALQFGVWTRAMVPLFHWTGTFEGKPQEFAMLFTYHTRGDHADSQEPAGMTRPGTTFL